jgi:glyoxylase-like metal-dependent hydrolase (beta-lactamase superfamily II)
MKIIPLSEGSFTIDQTKEFVPFDLSRDQLQERPKGSLLVEIQPFVVITSKDTLLLDAGLGFSDDNDVLMLHDNLIAHDIDPMSITKVLMTHLHKDHAGGLVKYDAMRKDYFLSFPQAEYFINKKEMHLAMQGNNPSYKKAQLHILSQSSQVVLTEDQGIIDDYISYEVTAAHAPHHQVFKISDSAEIIFFGGDDAPQWQQMKSRFVAKYDHDGQKAMQLRKDWWEQGEREKWTFLFYHDIKRPVWKF